MDDKKYNVVLLNQLSDTKDRSQVIQNLTKLFKSNEQKIEHILGKAETTIKKDVDKATAEKFYKAITTAGANCKLEEIQSEEDFVLPEISQDIPKVEETAAAAQHRDPTFQEIPSLESELNTQLSLEEKKLSEAQKKKEAAANVSADRLCPVCGTIRATGESECIHCGYDPVKAESNEKKAKLSKLATIAIITIVVLAGISIPGYLYFSKQMQIENGLLLAMETKNKVTAFVERTGFWPNQNIDADLPKIISNDVIESIVIGDKSVMTVTLRPEIVGAQNQTIIFKPNKLKGQIVWNCTAGTLESSYRPEVCRIQD